MPNINIPASGHIGPAPIPGGHQYLPYTDARHLATLRRAIQIIDARIRGHAPCNQAFRALPGRRSFAEVWGDNSVWINFDPSVAIEDYGATRGNEVTITAFSLNGGIWTVAATLVHEFAHVNGAPGDTHEAEGTLRSCLLKNLENPAIIGKITGPLNSIRLV
jgi:hypothetical protein